MRLEPLEERRLLTFSQPVDYGVGLNPIGLVAADFNGDGRIDLAALDKANTVNVLLGNGEGTFQLPRTSRPGDGPKALVAGDLNGDGNDDLVTLNQFDLSVLLANGDGTFAPPQTITPPMEVPPENPEQGDLVQGPVSVALGDFNGDGKLDIVAGGQTVWFTTLPGPEGGHLVWHVNSYANVLLGRDDGTFAPAIVKHLVGGYPLLHPGDFNNDGRLDVVLKGGSALGNGDGTLQDFVESSAYIGDESQSVGDFNGDSKLDLLSIVSYAGGPFLQLGNGDGTFQQGQYLDHSFYQHGAVAGDVNADGKLDVVSLRSEYEASDEYGTDITATRSARVLLVAGNGTFPQPIVVDFDTVAGQTDFRAPVLADFDGDGFPDLAMIETITPTSEGPVIYRSVYVALNDGNWLPPPAPPPSIITSDVTVTEGNTGTRAVAFTVTLSAAYGQPVTVMYATANGTATAGSDYVAATGTLTIPAGQTAATITVQVKGDRLGEANETFFVNLSGPTNATIADGEGVGTIVDDEPRISISDVTKSEGTKGQITLFTFTVTLSAACDQPVTLSFRTVDGTATGNSDYVAKTGTLTFAPGEAKKTITIEVKGDSKKEVSETLYLDLFGLSGNGSFTKNRGIGTILNDD